MGVLTLFGQSNDGEGVGKVSEGAENDGEADHQKEGKRQPQTLKALQA